MKILNQQSLVATFTNTKLHETVAGIIYAHSTNKKDVRAKALDGLQLQDVHSILDLGCGFGFFTRSLKGRINKDAKIMGIDQCADYQDAYLNSCTIAGIEGRFKGAGAETIDELDSNSFDLIICSYAMYFFPEIIPQIYRILKPDGIFVTITHSSHHLLELFSYIKKAFKAKQIKIPKCLPYEKLMSNFNNISGGRLLGLYFKQIRERDYCSSLVFKEGDAEYLEKYLKFKRPFYVPESASDGNVIYDEIIEHLCSGLTSGIPFKITKDDTIYICNKPTSTI